MGSLKEEKPFLLILNYTDHPSHFHFSTPPPCITSIHASLLLAHPLRSVRNWLLHEINILKPHKVSRLVPELASAIGGGKCTSMSVMPWYEFSGLRGEVVKGGLWGWFYLLLIKTCLCLVHFKKAKWINPVTEEGKEGLLQWRKEKAKWK